MGTSRRLGAGTSRPAVRAPLPRQAQADLVWGTTLPHRPQQRAKARRVPHMQALVLPDAPTDDPRADSLRAPLVPPAHAAPPPVSPDAPSHPPHPHQRPQTRNNSAHLTGTSPAAISPLPVQP